MSLDEPVLTPSGNPANGELATITPGKNTWSGQIGELLQQLAGTAEVVSNMQIVINLDRPEDAVPEPAANSLLAGMFTRQAFNGSAVITWLPDDLTAGIDQHETPVSLAEKTTWEQALGGSPLTDTNGNPVADIDTGIVIIRFFGDTRGVAIWFSNDNKGSYIVNEFQDNADNSLSPIINLPAFNKCMSQNQAQGAAKAFSQCASLIWA